MYDQIVDSHLSTVILCLLLQWHLVELVIYHMYRGNCMITWTKEIVEGYQLNTAVNVTPPPPTETHFSTNRVY